MKRFIVFVVGLAFASGALAFNTDKPSIVPPGAQPAKTAPMKVRKETRVSFAGIVKEISDTTIMIERSVKGNEETMEFALDKPVQNIKAGDKVKITYIKKEGKNIAIKVTPVVAKKIIKKEAPVREVKPAPAETTPQKK